MTTKKEMILQELRLRSLNRFEASRLGDTCLNTTVAQLRADGHVLYAAFEDVPTRFGKTVRVKRYSLLREARP
ncbi:MAG: hypothetical protein ACK5JE_11745 [Castellaniella sp.]|uniref:hypothetical protein n=1 Tax=Castellaniella sp. TaxID=1955812 RepID=UPI003A888F9D